MIETAVYAGSIAAIIGIVKSFLELPKWGPPLLAFMLALGVVALGLAGGEIRGTPLGLVMTVVGIALQAIGTREVVQTGAIVATGTKLVIRKPGV